MYNDKDKRMTILSCETPLNLVYKETAVPLLADGEALIKVRRLGICGTDIHAYRGKQPYFSYPRVLGHELAGEVVDIKGAGFLEGEQVAVIPYLHCGACIACRAGRTNCCASMKVIGVHQDGGMADYLSVPITNLFKADGLTLDDLAILEPFAIGAHGIKRAAIKPKEHIIIIGAGPIGIAAAAFACMAGGRVVVVDVNADRLAFCRSSLNVEVTIDESRVDTAKRVREITSGEMASVVIDCSGSLSAINKSFRYMAHAGRYVLIGLQKDPITVDHPEFHKREGTLMSSRNATVDDFYRVADAIKEGVIKASDYITQRLPFSQLADRFNTLVDPAGLTIKTLVDMDA